MTCRGVEPLLLPWKGSVLTTWLTGQIWEVLVSNQYLWIFSPLHRPSLLTSHKNYIFWYTLSNTLNGTRTRISSLRGWRPKPLVDESIFGQGQNWTADTWIFSPLLLPTELPIHIDKTIKISSIQKWNFNNLLFI